MKLTLLPKLFAAAMITAVATPAALSASTIASDGPCSSRALAKKCRFDEIAYYNPSISSYTEETVIAYGRMWVFDNLGRTLQPGTDLHSIPRYANGPCRTVPVGRACKIDSLTITNLPGLGYTESVTAYGSYWNFDRAGNPYPDGSGDLRAVPRYYGPVFGPGFGFPCNPADQDALCQFATRTLVEAPEWQPGLTESITAYGQYFLYDSLGNVIGNDDLTQVARYVAGPCRYRPAGALCRFDSLDFKRVNGSLIEVITAYGRYWEFLDGSDTPLPGSDVPVSSVARYQ